MFSLFASSKEEMNQKRLYVPNHIFDHISYFLKLNNIMRIVFTLLGNVFYNILILLPYLQFMGIFKAVSFIPNK